MTVFIVDSGTGELKAIRSLGLGHVVSTNLGKECNRLLSIQPFSLADYHSKVNRIYRKYALSEYMLPTAKPENMFIIATQ